MTNSYSRIQALLQDKADLTARLKFLPYDGTPEIKIQSDVKYIYIRKRVGSRLTSSYVDVYSDDLYNLLLKNSAEAKDIKKKIRKIEKELALSGYNPTQLDGDILLNLDFARANLKANIYDQAVLEGVGTSFPQTEDIIDNGIVNGVSATDVQKILNLKHAWEFILDKDVISYPTGLDILCHIGKLVNEGFYADGGRIRGVPVTIGGTNYIPPLPVESIVRESINEILLSSADAIDTAISLCLYTMKTQVFNDGNKRSAVIFANHYLISKGKGLLIIPQEFVPEFKRLLILHYEGKDGDKTREFVREKCIRSF